MIIYIQMKNKRTSNATSNSIAYPGQHKRKAPADNEEFEDDDPARGLSTNPPFDPSGLHAGHMFDMAKLHGPAVSVGATTVDLTPRRMVLGGFDAQCAIIHKAVSVSKQLL